MQVTKDFWPYWRKTVERFRQLGITTLTLAQYDVSRNQLPEVALVSTFLPPSLASSISRWLPPSYTPTHSPSLPPSLPPSRCRCRFPPSFRLSSVTPISRSLWSRAASHSPADSPGHQVVELDSLPALVMFPAQDKAPPLKLFHGKAKVRPIMQWAQEVARYRPSSLCILSLCMYRNTFQPAQPLTVKERASPPCALRPPANTLVLSPRPLERRREIPQHVHGFSLGAERTCFAMGCCV